MYYLYMLTSTLDDKCYLGITNNKERRLTQHLIYGRYKKYHNARWINKILENNGEINMNIISENISKKDAIFYEKFFIKLYRGIGLKLTNIADGGLGFSHKGVPHSEKHKKNIEKSQPHKVRIPKDILYDLYVNKKLSKNKIGEIYNCGPNSVHRRLVEYDIPIRTTKNYKISHKIDKDKIIKLYLDDDLSMLKISRKLKVNSNVIRDLLIRNNIDTNRYQTKIRHINKYDLNGEFIKSYDLDELCKELNKKRLSIYSYIKTYGTCWGYKWEIVYK